TEIIGWPKWGSAAVVMMLACSECEPPNGYGVTNCNSLSGNALAALVSVKATVEVVASEATDRRVVMMRAQARMRRLPLIVRSFVKRTESASDQGLLPIPSQHVTTL